MESTASTNLSESSTAESLEVSKWAEVLNIVLLTTITVIGVIGNGVILIVQLKNRNRSSTDTLVATMAAFEFFCSGINIPVRVFENITSIWQSIASVTLCFIKNYISYVSTISTTLLLAVIAIDRYILICKPWNTFYSKEKSKWISVAIVILSVTYSVPSIVLTTLDSKRLTCELTQKNPTLQFVYSLVGAAVYAFMFVVVIFCYTKVSLVIHRRHRLKNSLRQAQASSLNAFNNYNKTLPKPQNVFVIGKNKICPQDSGASGSNQVAPESISDIDIRRKKPENHDDVGISLRKVKGYDINDRNEDVVQLQREERAKVYRTTLIMFLITTIYVFSWVLHWLSNALVPRSDLAGRNVVYLTTNLYLINCVTNPIFFIAMSSKFRVNARMLFKGQ